MRLEGKVAIVTGAASGMGASTARIFAREGCKVVVADQLDEDGRKIAAEITAANGAASFHHLDVTDEANWKAVVEATIAEFGKLDILVNNAGFTRDGLAMRMKDEDWSEVIEVNLTAAFRLARASLRGMMKRREGRIISITSVVGVSGNPGQVNYCAAKAGMIGMTKSLAQEVASRGITVNCVAPGFIETPMTDALNEQQRERILQNLPAGRLGKSDEIAASVVYLASREAAYVTGQTIHVNGGLLMP
jgi:3-oxoacyl-[acyl-carrier protein] reductase